MVALESDLPIVEAPLAQTRVFEYQTMDGA
jgi:hypothetical protein